MMRNIRGEARPPCQRLEIKQIRTDPQNEMRQTLEDEGRLPEVETRRDDQPESPVGQKKSHNKCPKTTNSRNDKGGYQVELPFQRNAPRRAQQCKRRPRKYGVGQGPMEQCQMDQNMGEESVIDLALPELLRARPEGY
jgi:hypothetical protein